MAPRKIARVALLLLLASPAIAFNKRQVECEETAAFLDDCCGSVNVNCSHELDSGCGGGDDPQFTVKQSKCLREHSCQDIEAAGICAAGYVSADALMELCP